MARSMSSVEESYYSTKPTISSYSFSNNPKPKDTRPSAYVEDERTIQEHIVEDLPYDTTKELELCDQKQLESLDSLRKINNELLDEINSYKTKLSCMKQHYQKCEKLIRNAYEDEMDLIVNHYQVGMKEMRVALKLSMKKKMDEDVSTRSKGTQTTSEQASVAEKPRTVNNSNSKPIKKSRSTEDSSWLFSEVEQLHNRTQMLYGRLNKLLSGLQYCSKSIDELDDKRRSKPDSGNVQFAPKLDDPPEIAIRSSTPYEDFSEKPVSTAVNSFNHPNKPNRGNDVTKQVLWSTIVGGADKSTNQDKAEAGQKEDDATILLLNPQLLRTAVSLDVTSPNLDDEGWQLVKPSRKRSFKLRAARSDSRSRKNSWKPELFPNQRKKRDKSSSRSTQPNQQKRAPLYNSMKPDTRLLH